MNNARSPNPHGLDSHYDDDEMSENVAVTPEQVSPQRIRTSIMSKSQKFHDIHEEDDQMPERCARMRATFLLYQSMILLTFLVKRFSCTKLLLQDLQHIFDANKQNKITMFNKKMSLTRKRTVEMEFDNPFSQFEHILEVIESTLHDLI